MMITYSKKLDVRVKTDVFVAGGGPAGAAAAIAAARAGKSVFLAESTGSFGGLASAALVPAFATFDDGKNAVCRGIGLEIRNRLVGGAPFEYWTPIRVEALKRVYDDMTREAGVDFMFFTRVCDVLAHDGHIDAVILDGKSGLYAVEADIYIDCTGDGDLISFAGGEYVCGDENGALMPPTLCSLFANVDFARRVLPDDRRLADAFAAGVFSKEDRHLPGMFIVDEKMGIGGGNIGHVYGVDPTNDASLTKAMVEGRRLLAEYERYYKEYLVGFESMTLVQTGAALGVRESRRIRCDYTLCEKDFLDRAVFDDEIGRYCYPIDIHRNATDEAEYARFLEEYIRKYRYEAGESYGIPLRSLIPVSFDNALVAGRCIGTDRPMQATERVMPGCFITGQAAGAAAAAAAMKKDVRSADVRTVQRILRQQDAYLPNAGND